MSISTILFELGLRYCKFCLTNAVFLMVYKLIHLQTPFYKEMNEFNFRLGHYPDWLGNVYSNLATYLINADFFIVIRDCFCFIPLTLFCLADEYSRQIIKQVKAKK